MVGTVKTGSEGSFESTPAFLALSDRIAETESTLASLSSTVEGLTQAVASLQSGRKTDTLPTATSLGSIASDDDARVTPGRQGSMSAGAIGDLMPSPSSSLLNGGSGTGIGSGNITDTATTAEPAENASAISANSDNIAALMQQVAALSMSVAQLQKIQHTQVQLTRSNSGSAPSPSMSGLTAASAAGAGVAGAGGVGGSVSMGGASGQGSAVGLAAGAAGIDRGDNVTPTPGAVGTIGARGGAGAGAGGRPTSGVIGGGQAGTGANMGSTISRSAAPTQLGMGSMGSMAGLTSSPSGPLPSTLLSPPLSSTGPAGRRLEQNRPGMGRSISSSVINSHLASPGLGPGQIPGAGQGQGGDDAGSRWQGHGHGPLSPSPTAFNPIAGAGAAIGAAAKRTGGPPGHLQMPSLSMGMAERVWSPGGMMTPRVEISQAAGGLGGPGTPTLGGAGGMGMGGGAATPGAGIVVTKWDHLNLKPELLRGIVKYGIGPPNKIQARVLPFMLRGSDIIAQAPPTQERIIAYVIPSLQLCLSHMSTGQYRGPTVIIVTTTVDQATQCQKLVRNIGGPLGIRSALVTGVAGFSGIQNEIAAVQRDAVHLLIGTPAKLNEVVSARGPMGGSDCRLLVLDEVDQLIARNLYDNVLSIAKFLPAPRRGGATTPGPGGIGAGTIGSGQGGPTFSPAIERVTSPYDAGQSSPFNPNSKTPFPGQSGARFGGQAGGAAAIERQTCIFSNTIPTDVINFSQSLNVRDPVRVLVRRDGGPNSQESVSSVTPGINLKHTYVYLTITGSAAARADASATVADGPGAIGSGRSTQGAGGSGQSEEANRAKEYKLDILGKLLDDYPMWQAVVHVGTFSMLEAVVYKLQSRQWETTYLSPDMPPAQKKAVLQQWRLSSPMNGGPRFMIIFDVNVKPPEVPWAPLIINFDLPRSVEGYAARAAAGVPPGGRNGQVVWQQQLIPGAVTGSGTQGQGQAQGQAQGQGQGGQGQGQGVFGVIVSFVQAAGGDVEMLRSTECAYRFKSAEIPSVFHDLF